MYRIWIPRLGWVFEDTSGVFKRSDSRKAEIYETPYSDFAYEFKRVMQQRCPEAIYHVVRMK